MGAMHPSKLIDSSLGLIVKRLRDDGKSVAKEALPARWVDLILYLDEQERKSVERSRPSSNEHLSLAEAELAFANQEKLLGELMRTDEPTEEATAVLKELRREVARALAARI